MGRPLKISKLNATTNVDLGFPNDGTTDNGFDDTEPGVYGGTIADLGGELVVYPGVAVEQKQYGTINAFTNATVIWGSDGADFTNTLDQGSIIYANGYTDPVGVVDSTNASVTVTCDSAAASTDLITTKGGVAATDLVLYGPIVFASDFAGLTAGTVYYVKSTPSGTTFSVSATPEGTTIQLTDDSDDVEATQATTATLVGDASVALSGSAWTSATPDNGYIIRQKGKKKYLVARRDNIQDEFIAAGGTYVITSVSNTDWAALGAGPDAGVGKIFTASVDGAGLSTDGVVYAVGVCTLVEEAQSDLTRNQMSISLTKGDSSTEYAATLTNHFAVDFTDNGSDENAGTKYIATLLGANSTADDATDLEFVSVQNND